MAARFFFKPSGAANVVGVRVGANNRLYAQLSKTILASLVNFLRKGGVFASVDKIDLR